MITENRNALILAVCLATLAGFTDALGFMELGGFFVSFMSGNSTRFAVSAAENGLVELTLIPLALIVLFVLGVMLGMFLKHYFVRHQTSALIGFVTLALIFAAASHATGHARAAIFFMVVAMGVENNVFLKDGQVNTGVTYMTGTLVKFAQKLAVGFLGGSKKDALPFLYLWLGLISGAILGAACYAAIGLNSLWLAAGFAGIVFTGIHLSARIVGDS
jgi:uncharacterized membrane protein YoaK (UPF0700 family)